MQTMNIEKLNPKKGASFLLTKDMGGTPIFQRITLGEAEITVEVGQLENMANARTTVIKVMPRGTTGIDVIAADEVKKQLQRLIDRHFELKESNLPTDTTPGESGSGDKYVDVSVTELRSSPDLYLCYARYYAGTSVVVNISPDGSITALDQGQQIELPNRIRSGLHKSREENLYSLSGTLTWVTPSDTDHASKVLADYHGGSKPNLVLDAVVDPDVTDVAACQKKLDKLCEDYKWERTPWGSSVYAQPRYAVDKFPENKATINRWSGVIGYVKDGTKHLARLNSLDTLVVVGINEEQDTLALVKFSNTERFVSFPPAKIPKSLKETLVDLCVPVPDSGDGKNYTRLTSKDFGLRANSVRWMHPKDYFAVKVDRDVLVELDLSKDVQLCEV